MGFQDGARVLRHFLALIGIREQMQHCPAQVRRGSNLNGPTLRHQRVCQRGKILHVWTEEDRFASKDGFGRVLSALREQTLSDKDERCRGVPVTQLAGCVDDQAIEKRIDGRRLAAQCDIEAHFRQLGLNSSSPLNMTRPEDKQKIDKIAPERAEDFAQDLLFTRVGAPTEDHRPIFQAKFSQHAPRQFGVDPRILRIKLDAADVTNSSFCDAERLPFFHVADVLNANLVQLTKRRRYKSSESSETFFGPRGQTGVYERNRNLTCCRYSNHGGPNF